MFNKLVVLEANPISLDLGVDVWKGVRECTREFVAHGEPAHVVGPELVLERIKGADAVLVNKIPLSESILKSVPTLSYIGVVATGYDIIDVDYVKRHSIALTNIPEYGTDSVAQNVFAHVLEHTQAVGRHTQAVKSGEWSTSEYFCYWRVPLMELSGKTMGVVGLGSIGVRVSEIARAFGMRVLVSTPRRKPDVTGVEYASLEDLLRESDVVSLHCPLTKETKNLVNKPFLEQMKPSAFLINTGRGGLVDEAALFEALSSRRIAGAGLDVLNVEPPRPNNPLLGCDNLTITPHNAWATVEARRRMFGICEANIKAYLKGERLNRLD